MAAGEQLRRDGADLAVRAEVEAWLRLRTRLMQPRSPYGAGRATFPARPPSPASLHPRLLLRLGQQFRQA
ncbi:hypothetical protein GA0115254_117363 [Streptomyces sp. Ncost-T10-10d]|nr:hypothetical protein GA0115254_117363 [Streptomyces sp. Ncost-T10-10d]